jgi:hypothetical protein
VRVRKNKKAAPPAPIWAQVSNAICADELGALRAQLAAGAPVSSGGRHALCLAAQWGRHRILKALLAAGVDAGVRDGRGRSALDCAHESLSRLEAGDDAGEAEISVEAASAVGGKYYTMRLQDVERVIGILTVAGRKAPR